MNTHKGLLLTLIFHFRYLELVSTKSFKRCLESYYEKKVPYDYVDTTNDFYSSGSSSTCKYLCNQDKKCTEYFLRLNMKGCYLSQRKNDEVYKDEQYNCSKERDCTWISYTKGWWGLFSITAKPVRTYSVPSQTSWWNLFPLTYDEEKWY